MNDPHSYARPDEARVRHFDLELDIDFDARRLTGRIALDIERTAEARQVVLDTRDLDILGVEDGAGAALDWGLGEADSILGRPLRIDLPSDGRIRVRYRTSPDAAAVQWLEPEQTAGGERPFLFTQGQAILTRTWIPIQDSPGIRMTYDARITVPRPLTAVMAAEAKTEAPAAEHRRTYAFTMPQPVPAYLVALAVGDLTFRVIGPRTGVWAEPATIDAAAHEFADMERMLEAAESLYGAYDWGRYDVLVLPPSFPFGGMENPRLTFATPTILAGDRSLVSLVAHELAHSWSGNLVTNATWDDFWVNEGFTVFFERRIMEALYGPERAAMENRLGRGELERTIEEFGEGSPRTRLKLDLAGDDPDEGMNPIAYEKGAAFLQTVEAAVGRDHFDRFLRDYFERHAFQSMTTERFLEHLERELIRGDGALRARIRPDAWVYEPGVPDNVVSAESAALERAEAQAHAFAGGADADALETDGWATQQWQHFLRSLPETLPPERMEALDRAFGLTATGNSEILFDWLRLSVRSRYEPAFGALEAFLTRQGRRKFLKPLYEALMERDWGRDLARRIYDGARPGYHAVSRTTIDEIVA